jgi:hypothetical protein
LGRCSVGPEVAEDVVAVFDIVIVFGCLILFVNKEKMYAVEDW